MKCELYIILTLIFLLSSLNVQASNLEIRSIQVIGIIQPGSQAVIDVYVVNTGTDSIPVKVEAGFYPRTLINSWIAGTGIQSLYLGGNAPITENCVPTERNVQTRWVSIPQGTGDHIQYILIANYDPSIGKQGYGIFAESFQNCASTGKDIGIQSKNAIPVIVTDSTPTPPSQASCTDGLKNGQETDVDCGGTTCPKCKIGNTCASNTDCQTSTCTQQSGKITCTEKQPVCDNQPPKISCGDGYSEVPGIVGGCLTTICKPINLCPVSQAPRNWFDAAGKQIKFNTCNSNQIPSQYKTEDGCDSYRCIDPLAICGDGRVDKGENCVTCPQEFGDKCGVQKPFDINEFVDKYLGWIIIGLAIIVMLVVKKK